MRLSVVFCFVFFLPGVASVFQQNTLDSEWHFERVRGHIDIAGRPDSVNVRSVIGCASFCSSVDDAVMPSLYFEPMTGQCLCNSTLDELRQDEKEPEIVYGTRRTLVQVETIDDANTKTTVWPYRHDCSDLLRDYHDNGVYVIQPPGGHVTETWCDMSHGGWTVIQRRMDGSEDFYCGWDDYVAGFGKRTGEYWLGLDNMHQLTKDGSELIVYLEAYPGAKPPNITVHYSSFKIGDKVSKYTLDITGYVGVQSHWTCTDSLASHNGHPFTTFDNDNDNAGRSNCAEVFKGAWWHNDCYRSSLNGQYFTEGAYSSLDSELWGTGIHWNECYHWGNAQSLKFAIMKIRRKA